MKAGALEAAGFLRRAGRSSGGERDDLLLIAKSVVAAMAAWMLAHHVLPPAVVTFAPFTALVVLQTTLYRSVRDCAQYLLAMAAGAVLAATLAATAGLHSWTFGLLTLIALALGRVRRLGEHGTQIAIVGIFAFSSGHGRIDYIGHLVASVAIGAICGLVAHLLLPPARHVRHRQEAVAELYTGIQRRVASLADAFEASSPDADQVRQWRREWRWLSAGADRIEHSIDTETENSRLNPRRSFDGAAQALPRAREAVTAAQRCLDHLRSITRTLDHAVDSGRLEAVPAVFRSSYASLLRTTATAMKHIGQTTRTDSDQLDEALEVAAAELDRAQQQPPEAQPAVLTLQGTLLTDAARLMADLREGRQALSPTT
ncbi:aromatic acid exporter family protein [Streptomyces sp. ISL-66]|uniref:FUSC family protein n=1 Tax=Streptomyces sp. ISL-66 TaxID=2819186 RepID=UPI002034D6C7|nr:aromatic acid exporter family protein [Streptomyces sp. ISL-66]